MDYLQRAKRDYEIAEERRTHGDFMTAELHLRAAQAAAAIAAVEDQRAVMQEAREVVAAVCQ